MPHTPVNELARQVFEELVKIRDIGEDEVAKSVDRVIEIQQEKLKKVTELRNQMFLLAQDPGAQKRYEIYAKQHIDKLEKE